MAIVVGEFLEIMERLAPAALAEDWDNVGLQVGNRRGEATSILATLDMNGEVLEEAVALGSGIILTHHPLIFQPLASASDDTAAGRLISRANREGIAVVAAHTNLDSARGGLADVLAELIGLQQLKPLEPAAGGWSKLAVFVPMSDLDRVRAALFAAGAGVIGDYEHCSFITNGTGTFLPMEGARPTVGKVGKDEQAPESRLEMVFPTAKTREITAALTGAHSYEEPAYDIFPLETRRRDAGSGRVGELSGEMELDDLAGSIAELFGMDRAGYIGAPDKPVRRIAIVPGSGAGYIRAAARLADVLVTGDFKYHQTLEARELDVALINLPHSVSESTALAGWLPRLERELVPHGVMLELFQPAEALVWRIAFARQRPHISDEGENSMHQLHVDGGSRGNPGPAGIGVVLADAGGETVDTLANYIGEATNNVAEYQAMISGLEMAIDRGIDRLAIFSDSELIVRQLEGAYRVKNEGLRPYYQQAKSLLSRLDEYELKSIPREANTRADELVNKALDESGH